MVPRPNPGRSHVRRHCPGVHPVGSSRIPAPAMVAPIATRWGTDRSSTTVGIKLDEDTRERLQQLSALKDRSPHWIMKTAIREYLEREEAYERERREDEERWARYLRTGAFVDNDTMLRWLDGLAEQARAKAGR